MQTKAQNKAMKAGEEAFEMNLPSFTADYLGQLVTAAKCAKGKRPGKTGREDLSCRQ